MWVFNKENNMVEFTEQQLKIIGKISEKAFGKEDKDYAFHMTKFIIAEWETYKTIINEVY